MERQAKEFGRDLAGEASAAGFPIDPTADPDFAFAVVRAMLASAYADGVLDAHEQNLVNIAVLKAGLTDEERALLNNEVSQAETLSLLADAAKSPHHAAELYAAAVVAAGDLNGRETEFLTRLADKLGLKADDAAAIRKNAHC